MKVENMAINHEFTYKLLYSKYAWKVVLILFSSAKQIKKGTKTTLRARKRPNAETKKNALKPILEWLDSNYPKSYRLLTSWRVRIVKSKTNEIYDECQLTIFINDQNAYNEILVKYHDKITDTMAPANSNHAELIKQGAFIEVRNKFYYNLYRYRVSFWGGWWGDTRTEIITTINDYLHDESKEDQNYKMHKSTCTLYLKELSDFMLIKLSLSNRIRDTRAISLISEI